MAQTEMDPVECARAIVFRRMARELSRSSVVEAAPWTPRSIVLPFVALLPSVALVVWVFTR